MNIICDTSFLMILVSKPIKMFDIIESYYGKINLLVPDLIVYELEDLEKKSNIKKSNNARTALEISRKLMKLNIPKMKSVDDSLIHYALLKKYPVATIDKELIKKLILNKIIVLTLQNDKLMIANTKEI